MHVSISPPLPLVYPDPKDWVALAKWMRMFIQALFDILRRHANSLNQMFPKDGEDPMTGPLSLVSIELAALPSAVGLAGALIYVPDSSNGPIIAYSDGADWLELAVEGVVS